MADPRHTPVIVGAARTPIGRFLGGLARCRRRSSGAIAIRAAIERAGIDPAEIDDVILGNVVSAGLGQAPARQAAIRGGVPEIGRRHGGQPRLRLRAPGRHARGPGDPRRRCARHGGRRDGVHVQRAVLPARLPGRRQVRQPAARGRPDPRRALVRLRRMPHGRPRGVHGVEGGDQPGGGGRFALESHRKAIAAIDAGKFQDGDRARSRSRAGKGRRSCDTDEPPRRDTSLEALAKLQPAFPSDMPPEVDDPVVTAGNAPGLNDGAAALVVDEPGVRARRTGCRSWRGSTRTRRARSRRGSSSSRPSARCGASWRRKARRSATTT